jgi:mannose/fructose/N-acetylgalactosamine-specific phosphotransferase system component IIC
MSEKSGILITLIVIMLMFNFIYAISSPDVTNNIVLNSLVGLITGSVVTGIISGFTLFGSGLNS